MISTTLRGDEPPETILALPLDKPSTSLRRDSTAALAFPRSGGVVTRTRNVSPSHPAIPLREDPGTTLMRSLKLAALNTNALNRSRCISRWNHTCVLNSMTSLLVYQLHLDMFCLSPTPNACDELQAKVAWPLLFSLQGTGHFWLSASSPC